MSNRGEPINLSIGDENGNGRNGKMLWWIVNVLLGLATTSLWLGYFDIQSKIDKLDRRLDMVQERQALRGERITAIEGRLNQLDSRLDRLDRGGEKWRSSPF